ncbi:MAG: signal peptidase I [Planctomycetota bacterium]|jgi:signal peptidase I
MFEPEPDADRGQQKRARREHKPLPQRPHRSLAHAAISFGAKSFVMLLMCWALCFNFSEVRGGSMMPGIQDRDRILVDHVSYLFGAPTRGDIVVLRYPMDPSLDYVKRVVGLPGDHVQICAGYVWVNDELVEEPYVDPDSNDLYASLDTIVEPESYFVLGDNRIRSSDSREFGQVPHEYLRGKVRVRLWPLTRAGLVD